MLPILKKNILILKCQNISSVIEKNIFNNLNFKDFKNEFDIIFMDPPYKEKNLHFLLTNIKKSNILSKQGVFILHRHKKEKDDFPEDFNIIEEKTYGISKVIFGNYT